MGWCAHEAFATGGANMVHDYFAIGRPISIGVLLQKTEQAGSPHHFSYQCRIIMSPYMSFILGPSMALLLNIWLQTKITAV